MITLARGLCGVPADPWERRERVTRAGEIKATHQGGSFSDGESGATRLWIAELAARGYVKLSTFANIKARQR